jgi:hypothetical protein
MTKHIHMLGFSALMLVGCVWRATQLAPTDGQVKAQLTAEDCGYSVLGFDFSNISVDTAKQNAVSTVDNWKYKQCGLIEDCNRMAYTPIVRVHSVVLREIALPLLLIGLRCIVVTGEPSELLPLK